MSRLERSPARLARYPAPARVAIFVLVLLLLWLPLTGPIYWIWGPGNTVTLVTLLLLYGAFIVLLRLWDRKVHQQSHSLRTHGLVGSRKNGLELCQGLGLGLSSLLCLMVIEAALGWLTWQLSPSFLPKLVLEGLGVALGVAAAEALLFRGWLLDELRWDYGFRSALWISSIIYALLHFLKPLPEVLRTLPSFPGLLLLGLTLGWLRQARTGRLGFSVGLHAGFVWGYYIIDVADLVRYTGRVPAWVTGMNQNPLAGGMGLLFLGFLAVVLYRQLNAPHLR